MKNKNVRKALRLLKSRNCNNRLKTPRILKDYYDDEAAHLMIGIVEGIDNGINCSSRLVRRKRCDSRNTRCAVLMGSTVNQRVGDVITGLMDNAKALCDISAMAGVWTII